MINSEIIDRMLHHQLAELWEADRMRLRALSLQFLMAIVAATSVFSNNSNLLLALAIGGMILLIGWSIADHYYRRHRAAGDQARRIVLITSGLGETISDISTFSDKFSANLDKVEKPNIAEYFASRTPPSPRRLSEMIDESAFFTGDLQRQSGKLMFCGLLFLLFGVVIVFFSMSLMLSSDFVVTLARAFLAVLVFLLSADVIGTTAGHHDAGAEMARIRLRLDMIRASGYPQSDLLLLMSDYNASVEAAPLILPRLYGRECSRLNISWSEYKVEVGLG